MSFANVNLYSAALPSYIPKKDNKTSNPKTFSNGKAKTEIVEGGLKGLINRLQTIR